MPIRPFREIPLFRDVSVTQWTDWRWQLQNVIEDAEPLEQLVSLTPAERAGIVSTQHSFRFSITPYYATLLDSEDPACPIRMQSIPVWAEAQRTNSTLRDPLGEDRHMPVPGLVHRYPDRALLLVNNHCAVYCRYCTRKRLTGEPNRALTSSEFAAALEYLRRTPQVREVILSGGEPLNVADTKLEQWLAGLREIPSIEILRVHTRAPVVLPYRITTDLGLLLRRYAPLFVVTHFNHPKELTCDAIDACGRLIDAGVPVTNQTVLLRRVNSSSKLLKDLFQRLLMARVTPYYLHQCDLAEGLEHLRTPIDAGIRIFEELQGWTSGLCVPRLVLDAPGGGGKIPLVPPYVITQSPEKLVFRNYERRRFIYPEPAETDCTVPYEEKWFAEAGQRPALLARPPVFPACNENHQNLRVNARSLL